MAEESVKVAVRVRPFNQRELDRGAKLCIEMKGNQTWIWDVNDMSTRRSFSFDYSYWSHDGFHNDSSGLSIPDNDHYSDQDRVFKDLGQGVLTNAFAGFNTSLFAYGQTGSGKSYSMVGYGVNKGIVPTTCDELFNVIAKNSSKNTRYHVTFSMLEIYNEQVRDLLSKDVVKGGLQVRQNPTLGKFYVQGLIRVPVANYDEIDRKMNEGTANRTVAATNMNATSSRAHTVVTVMFEQIMKDASGKETTRSSEINLVDLAGSERANSTGATGDRLKEGSAINKSLTCLGNVISALADQSNGKKVMVPYRDSTLTKLLANALGGNSKTVMIAALSPADINYEETLSTLRYADRAKQIKNKAVVNESETDKLIRSLKEENERLRKQLEAGLVDVSKQGLTKDEIDAMKKQMEEEIRAQLEDNSEMMNRNKNWEAGHAQLMREQSKEDKAIMLKQKKLTTTPHFANLNEDPQLSHVVFHFLEKAVTVIGKVTEGVDADISLSGLSISKMHAIISNKGRSITIKPGNTIAKTKVNGLSLDGEKALFHNDRVLFGSNHLYVFLNPMDPKTAPGSPELVTYEFAQSEIAKAKGYSIDSEGLTRDQQKAQEQVLELLPLIGEVNAISEELQKQRSFEIVLFTGAALGLTGAAAQSTKVMVRIKSLSNGNEWLWDRVKFMDRRFLMQALYQASLEDSQLTQKISGAPMHQDDPFFEPLQDVMIGTATVFLQSLSYALDIKDTMTITDYKGEEQGSVSIHIQPCNRNGHPYDEEVYVEEPSELLGKSYGFQVTILSAEIHKMRFCNGVRVQYCPIKQTRPTTTPAVMGTSPVFNHSCVFFFEKMTPELIEWLETGYLTVMAYATQVESVDSMPEIPPHVSDFLYDDENAPEAFMHRPSPRPTRKSKNATDDRVVHRLLAKEEAIRRVLQEFENMPESEQTYQALHKQVHAVLYAKEKMHIFSRIIGKSRVKVIENSQTAVVNSSLENPIARSKTNAPSQACVVS